MYPWNVVNFFSGIHTDELSRDLDETTNTITGNFKAIDFGNLAIIASHCSSFFCHTPFWEVAFALNIY